MTALKITVESDAARAACFRALIQEGLADLDKGRFETVDDIEAWMGERGRTPPQ